MFSDFASLVLPFLFLMIVVGFLGFILRPPPHKPSYAYRPLNYLLTKAERSFYGVLLSVLPDDYQVMCKVRLADLIKPSVPKNQFYAAFSRIAQKHIDFVIVRKTDLSVVAAIELNDSSHSQRNRVERDLFVRDAMKSASVPFLPFAARQSYSPRAPLNFA